MNHEISVLNRLYYAKNATPCIDSSYHVVALSFVDKWTPPPPYPHVICGWWVTLSTYVLHLANKET